MTEAAETAQDHVFGTGMQRDDRPINNQGNTHSAAVKHRTGAEWIGTSEVAHHNGETVCDRWRTADTS